MRFRRRVSPTSLTPPLRFARPAPLRHFSRAPFLLSRVTGFTLSTLLPCCSRPYSFPRASNPFDQLHFRRSAIPRSPPFSASAAATSPRRISTVAHPRLFRPDLFERQNVLGTLILCGSERAREKGRRREERGLFFLKAETRTMRVLRVLRRTCSPVRDVMVDEGGRRSRGGKKRWESHSAENEKVRRRVTTRWPRGWPDKIIGYTRYR